jgi:hypothetical protein
MPDSRWVADPRFLRFAWAACNRPETCRERRTQDDPCWRCQEQASDTLRLVEAAGFVLTPRQPEPAPDAPLPPYRTPGGHAA